jgi:hypothetical protein
VRQNAYTATVPSDPHGLLLYGGEGGTTDSHGNLLNDGDFQDLWRFDLINNTWVHILGTDPPPPSPPEV